MQRLQLIHVLVCDTVLLSVCPINKVSRFQAVTQQSLKVYLRENMPCFVVYQAACYKP